MEKYIEILRRTQLFSGVSDSEISAMLHLAPERVNGLLTVLEMKGLVQAALGKIFLAK